MVLRPGHALVYLPGGGRAAGEPIAPAWVSVLRSVGAGRGPHNRSRIVRAVSAWCRPCRYRGGSLFPRYPPPTGRQPARPAQPARGRKPVGRAGRSGGRGCAGPAAARSRCGNSRPRGHSIFVGRRREFDRANRRTGRPPHRPRALANRSMASSERTTNPVAQMPLPSLDDASDAIIGSLPPAGETQSASWWSYQVHPFSSIWDRVRAISRCMAA